MMREDGACKYAEGNDRVALSRYTRYLFVLNRSSFGSRSLRLHAADGHFTARLKRSRNAIIILVESRDDDDDGGDDLNLCAGQAEHPSHVIHMTSFLL